MILKRFTFLRGGLESYLRASARVLNLPLGNKFHLISHLFSIPSTSVETGQCCISKFTNSHHHDDVCECSDLEFGQIPFPFAVVFHRALNCCALPTLLGMWQCTMDLAHRCYLGCEIYI